MKSNTKLRQLVLAGIASLIPVSSFAQDSGYFYGGLSFGQSRANIDEPRITANLLAAGLATTSINSDERDGAFRLFSGYQVDRNFGIEAGYFRLGKFGFTSTTTPAGTLDGRIRLQGLNLDLVGTWPLSDNWAAIARIGAQYASARDTFRGTGAVVALNPNPSKREINYKLGVGLQYQLSPTVMVRGEAERYRINDAVGNHGGVNVLSVSIVFPFGRMPNAAPRAMATPTYTAQNLTSAPASEPVVVVGRITN